MAERRPSSETIKIAFDYSLSILHHATVTLLPSAATHGLEPAAGYMDAA